jgi:PAS fold
MSEPFELSVDDYRRTFVHPDDHEVTTRIADAAYVSGEPVSWERRLIRRDGEVIWETLHAGYELDEHGRPLRAIGVVQDITIVCGSSRSCAGHVRASSRRARVSGCAWSAISTTAPRTASSRFRSSSQWRETRPAQMPW